MMIFEKTRIFFIIIGLVLIAAGMFEYFSNIFEHYVQVMSTILMGIFFFLLGVCFTERLGKIDNDEINKKIQSKITPINLWEKDPNKISNFLRAKDSIITYYSSVASAQTIRLIGFTTGLFTLIGLDKLVLNDIMPELPFNYFEELVNSFDLYVPFFYCLSVFILFYFIFRSIFRYATFSKMSNSLFDISLEQTEKIYDHTLHAQIVKAQTLYFIKYSITIFFFPIWFFYSADGVDKTKYGKFICILLSTLATFFLLSLIF